LSDEIIEVENNGTVKTKLKLRKITMIESIKEV
jgi:hypothetical protein